jgi:hypothetical protein
MQWRLSTSRPVLLSASKPAGERDLINRIKILAPHRAEQGHAHCCSTAG